VLTKPRTATMTRVREDASCQSLQPTCCQRAPLKPTNSRARDSHLPDRLIRVWPSPNTLVMGFEQHRQREHRIARRHLRSRVMPQFGVAAPAVTSSPLSPQARPPRFFLRGVSSHIGLLSLHENRTVRSPALPVASRRAIPLSRNRPMRSREPVPWDTHQTHPLSGPEAPSAHRSLPPRPCWR